MPLLYRTRFLVLQVVLFTIGLTVSGLVGGIGLVAFGLPVTAPLAYAAVSGPQLAAAALGLATFTLSLATMVEGNDSSTAGLAFLWLPWAGAPVAFALMIVRIVTDDRRARRGARR